MLIKKFVNSIISSWEKTRIIDPNFKAIYQYGLELLFSSLLSFVLVAISGTIFLHLPMQLYF